MAGLKSLKKTRRIQVVVMSFLAIGAMLVLFSMLPSDAFQYYRSPTEVLAEPPRADEVFRMGGLVSDGSIVRGQGETVSFSVTDGAETVPVRYTGVLPDLFAENQGMIGTGTYVDGVFEASEILAKHDEEYMPKEVVDSLKESGVYVEPTD